MVLENNYVKLLAVKLVRAYKIAQEDKVARGHKIAQR